MSRVKCVLLYSGGLDSLLAAKVLMEMGIEVTGLHCILPYFPPDLDIEGLKSTQLANQIGLQLIHYRCGVEYIDMLRKPCHGYGKEINPCIDCKLFFMKIAAGFINELNADFVATGEVVGQRPMSQLKHTLNHIEKESGLAGKLLRPLSAKLLKPTIAETDGRVDRNSLLDINGRGRKRQFELAKIYGITDFELPGGGCLFTDSHIASRIRDAFKYFTNITPLDLCLLKFGRHFRINEKLKIIVSRNQHETEELEKYSNYADYFFRPEFSGPSIFVKGIMSGSDKKIISGILTRYSKLSEPEKRIIIYMKNEAMEEIAAGSPVNEDEIDLWRI
ncbi:MAG TPA: tRNA 4-thiouridine(8) synthase ThiI [Spirochaetota bacterium]|nr:tRNA 4-thiouridine(8) synthase ThiI [Spirochaetota bacterium]